MMHKRARVIMLAAGCLLSSNVAARAQSPAPNRVVTATQGVLVTASLPLQRYPRNALARVWIGIRNVTRHLVYVPGACTGPSNPNARVFTRSGSLVFPPTVQAPEPSGPPVMACMTARPFPLKPGHGLHWLYSVVLRGSRVVVHVGIASDPTDYLSSDWIPATLHIQLTPSDAPALTLHAGTYPSIDVGPSPGTGPLHMTAWWLCPGDYRGNGARGISRQVGIHIPAPCPGVTEWHGVVGRFGHSLARFDYVSPGS